MNAEVIRSMTEEISAASFHMSGKRQLNSGMRYRKDGVSMGLPAFDEFTILRTDGEEIRKACAVLRSLGKEI